MTHGEPLYILIISFSDERVTQWRTLSVWRGAVGHIQIHGMHAHPMDSERVNVDLFEGGWPHRWESAGDGRWN